MVAAVGQILQRDKCIFNRVGTGNEELVNILVLVGIQAFDDFRLHIDIMAYFRELIIRSQTYLRVIHLDGPGNILCLAFFNKRKTRLIGKGTQLTQNAVNREAVAAVADHVFKAKLPAVVFCHGVSTAGGNGGKVAGPAKSINRSDGGVGDILSAWRTNSQGVVDIEKDIAFSVFNPIFHIHKRIAQTSLSMIQITESGAIYNETGRGENEYDYSLWNAYLPSLQLR